MGTRTYSEQALNDAVEKATEEMAWNIWEALTDRIKDIEKRSSENRTQYMETYRLYGLEDAVKIVEELYPDILGDE